MDLTCRILRGDKVKQVYTAWNTAVKLAWGCPQQTYILQQVLNCGYSSTRMDIVGRYVKFFHSLRNSPCKEIQVLSRLLARLGMFSL